MSNFIIRNLNIRNFKFSYLIYNSLLSLSCLVPIFILPGHIYVLFYFWYDYSREIDRSLCSCSCWDTVFKGSYETGIASYKHIYFNATENAMKIWISTILFFIIIYECIKTLFWCAINCQLRFSMCLMFLTSLFPHYYSWWCYMNYYNDDYYKQWYHQIYFTCSEIVSSLFILYLSNKTHPYTIKKLSVIAVIAFIHIGFASYDQFIYNVIKGKGFSHQIIRDIGFMIPDLLNFILPSNEIYKLYKISQTKKSYKKISLKSATNTKINFPIDSKYYNAILKISIMICIGYSLLIIL